MRKASCEPRARMITVMTVRELRAELQSRGLSMSGGRKEPGYAARGKRPAPGKNTPVKASDWSRVDPVARLIGAWFMFSWCYSVGVSAGLCEAAGGTEPDGRLQAPVSFVPLTPADAWANAWAHA